MRPNHFLFSFGSNLDTAQLVRRCPGAVILGTAVVPGYQLAFGGFSTTRDGAVATMERAGSRARCYGVVAAMDDADVIRMDACEGAAYERVLVAARPRSGALADGGTMMVQTYMLRDPRLWLPAPRYVGIIARAYATWGFDIDLLTAAVNRSVRAVRLARTASERAAARREAERIARVRERLTTQPMLPAVEAMEAAAEAEAVEAAEARRRRDRMAMLGVTRRDAPVTQHVAVRDGVGGAVVAETAESALARRLQ